MSPPTLIFGWRSAIFSVAILQLLLLAAALTRPIENRVANRCLAALLLVLAGMLVPFAIGFAGCYDRWPWLSFAPFAVPLAVGPLLWCYTRALVTGRLPPRPWPHLAPAAAQFGFGLASFCLPLRLKGRWDDLSSPIVDPLVAAGVLAGLLGYGLASHRLLVAYRVFLAQRRSDDHLYAARWLGGALAAMALLLVTRAGYQLADLIHPLDYFGMIGLYLAIGAVGLYLGVEGWRHAGRHFPTLGAAAAPAPPDPQDWRRRGEAWAAATRAGGWAADPELSLGGLARRLGTNASYLSRALNEGLGVSFSTFVNGLRAEAVAEAIRVGQGGDLLTLALAAGFSSKASFNRAFRARFGVAPSAWRRMHGSDRVNQAEAGV